MSTSTEPNTHAIDEHGNWVGYDGDGDTYTVNADRTSVITWSCMHREGELLFSADDEEYHFRTEVTVASAVDYTEYLVCSLSRGEAEELDAWVREPQSPAVGGTE